MNEIRVYKWDDCWWFDDPVKIIIKEELVMGSPEFIEKRLAEGSEEFNLIFSDREIVDCDFVLEFSRFEESGYIYQCRNQEMWLCSVLKKYYDIVPENLYLKVKFR